MSKCKGNNTLINGKGKMAIISKHIGIIKLINCENYATAKEKWQNKSSI